MAIISFDKDAIIDYVPRYADNRDSVDPCIVRIRFVPFSRVQHYSRVLAARIKGTSSSEKIEERTREVQRKQFIENVESVSGYLINEKEVTDAGEFYDTADTDLVLEVLRAMESQSRLDEGQRKNFQSASGSSSSARTGGPLSVISAPESSERTGIAATDASLESLKK